MDDNPQEHGPVESETHAEATDWREERRRRREARGGRYGNAWVGGAVLILLGVVFLLQNLGALSLTNWWALFILIPAVGAFGNAWRSYQAAGGRLTGAARSALIGGLVLTMVSAAFLLNLRWGVVGPLLLILAGIGLFLNAFLPK